ncbi:MAG: hypothetical protein KDC18_12405 [Alphaproteobacteria bacterium]|nr:hypothetical protein [Alphaproteobacteria bacterium]MCB9929380.1 hypothetical protein [Alphaproteobacteria bacterium]
MQSEPMHTTGSCYCGSVRFSWETYVPVPYLRCHCSICRKGAGEQHSTTVPAAIGEETGSSRGRLALPLPPRIG